METSTQEYAIRKTVNLPFEEADARVREALSAEGFGVLTEIDVKETLKKKLDVEFRPYRILGACNPPLAHRALSAEADIGLLLPCNVIVYESDEAGSSVVAAIDPVVQLGATGKSELEEVAREVKERLERVLAAL
ncbi:MAG: DUF302 domain-containing protein [Gemmatimonadota bacterium]